MHKNSFIHVQEIRDHIDRDGWISVETGSEIKKLACTLKGDGHRRRGPTHSRRTRGDA